MNRYGFLNAPSAPATKRLANVRKIERDGEIKTTKPPRKHPVYSSLNPPAMVCYEPAIIEKETRFEAQKMIDEVLDLGYDYTKNPDNADIIIVAQPGDNYRVKKPIRKQNIQVVPLPMFFARGK